MLKLPGRMRGLSVGRATRRARPGDPEPTDSAVAGGVGPSYSVRICGRCRTVVERAPDGRAQCATCGRTRGWI